MVWAQGQVKWAKVAYKSSTYDITHKKSAPPTKKIFSMSFEPLNSSLPLLAPKLKSRKATCNPVVLARESLKPTRRQSVKLHCSLFVSHFSGVIN